MSVEGGKKKTASAVSTNYEPTPQRSDTISLSIEEYTLAHPMGWLSEEHESRHGQLDVGGEVRRSSAGGNEARVGEGVCETLANGNPSPR